MASLFARFFLIFVLAFRTSQAADLDRAAAGESNSFEERACKPSTAKIPNGGFESGTLSPWTWHWTNHSVPMTAKIVKGGYESSHSVELHADVAPWFDSPSGSTDNTGRLKQNFKICRDGHYKISWFYYQVPGATMYEDSILDTRDLDVFIIYNTGYAQWLGAFTLYKTYFTCDFCDGDKHYPTGKWHEFYGKFYATEPGTFTLEFRNDVSAFARDAHDVQTKIRLDKINIKRIGPA